MDDERMEVGIVERCMIAPKTPTLPSKQELFLSSLDLFWSVFHYNRRLLFYFSEQQDAFVQTLKDSLAHVLVPFYPAAGRLAVSSTASDGRLCIDCNGSGVEFIVATAADSADFSHLEAQTFQPCPFFNKLAPYDVHPLSDIFTMPLLAIQVTKFKSGGVVVGFAHSHVLADGHSIWHFMISWAECARKVPISMTPLHMRTALAVDKPLVEKAFLPCPPEGLSVDGVHKQPQVNSKEPLMERYFWSSGEFIQKLKQEANGGIMTYSSTYMKENGCEFSSYEAMCAYWWKRVTLARQLEGETIVRFGVMANMRSRLKPKLPPAYFGNAVIMNSVYASASEILQESLASTAARIHKASLASSEEYMWGIIHWLELHGHVFDSKFFSRAPSVKTTSSPRFQVYDVDYGYGRPLAVRTAKTKGDGEMVLFPSRDGDKGAVELCLPLTFQAMENFLSLS